MEINDIGGLPAHPLIVHLPVVLVPLATVGAILMLLRPSWRRMFEIPTAVLAVVAAIATQLALQSGEALEEQVRHSELIERHSNIAEQARPWVFLFAAVMVAVVVWDVVQRRRAEPPAGDDGGDVAVPAAGGTAGVATVTVAQRPRAAVRSRAATIAVAIAAVGVLLGAVSTVQIYRTGHSGATATWHDTAGGTNGDGDGDGD